MTALCAMHWARALSHALLFPCPPGLGAAEHIRLAFEQKQKEAELTRQHRKMSIFKARQGGWRGLACCGARCFSAVVVCCGVN